MEINIKDKLKIDSRIHVGDIFYSTYTNTYSYLTPTHQDDYGNAMYSLVTISNPGSYYTDELSNLPLNDIIYLISEDENLKLYSQNEYDFKLEIISKDFKR